MTPEDETQSGELLASAEGAAAQGQFREAIALADRAAAVASGQGVEELHIQVGAIIVKRDALVELGRLHEAVDAADEIVALCRPFPELHQNAVHAAVQAAYSAARIGDARLTVTQADKLVALFADPLSPSDVQAACSLLLLAVSYLPTRDSFMRLHNARGTAERATTVARQLCTLATELSADLPELAQHEVGVQARVALMQHLAWNLKFKSGLDPLEQLTPLSTADYEAAERILARADDIDPDRRDAVSFIVALERQRRGDPGGAQRLFDEVNAGSGVRSAVSRVIWRAAQKLS